MSSEPPGFASGTRVARCLTRMPMHTALVLDTEHELDQDFRPILVRADPNGLAYEHREDRLFVADSRSGAILRIEGDRHHQIATVGTDGVAGDNRIGAITVTPDGTLFVTRPGYGQAGGVFRIDVGGQVRPLQKLPPQCWRLGITYDVGEHALYTTQFLTSKRGAHDGSVVAIDLVTGEPSTILDGFGKPIGIVKLGPILVIADARQRAVFRVELVAGRAVTRLQLAGDIDRPDSLCASGVDSVLVTTYNDEMGRGTVRRLWLDGRTRLVASGAWEPKGIATDGERVFVSARRGGRILVFPLT